MEHTNGDSNLSSQGQTQITAGKMMKRIIICCDGTWQDGFNDHNKQKHSNITRIARAMNNYDHRTEPPIHQVVFYQTGVGSINNWYSKYVEGAVGSTLGVKVEEAYGFITLNYNEGDEIFIFGFSRGAYTARMIAMLIGAVGILERKDLDFFPEILAAYQTTKKSKDDSDKSINSEFLKRWTDPNSPSQIRARMAGGESAFSIKFVGVMETVGGIGIPTELLPEGYTDLKKRADTWTMFGFPDRILGEHIEKAYHAIGINEVKDDFMPCLFEQTPQGKAKGQILHQCWFSGEHDDIGGGFTHHDLADLTLYWMMANVMEELSVNAEFLKSIPNAVAPWGEQKPHNPLTGIFALSRTRPRDLPTETDDITYQTIHSSVLRQKNPRKDLMDNIKANPALIVPLMPFEEEMQKTWTYSESTVSKIEDRIETEKSPVGNPAYEGLEAKLEEGIKWIEKKLHVI